MQAKRFEDAVMYFCAPCREIFLVRSHDGWHLRVMDLGRTNVAGSFALPQEDGTYNPNCEHCGKPYEFIAF